MIKEKSAIVIGYKPVEDLLASDTTVGKVIINRNAEKHKIGVLRKMAQEKNVPFQMVPPEKLNRVTRANHQGVIAYVSPIDYVPLEETVTRLFESGKPPKIVVVDGVNDVRNIGAIARSCLAFDVDLLVTGIKNNAEIGEGAVKSSAGALLKLPVARAASLEPVLSYFNAWGMKIVAATEKGESFDYSTDIFNENDAWVLWLGGEESGIPRERLKFIDKHLKIDMIEGVDSLNVSVAAGIFLHYFYMKR